MGWKPLTSHEVAKQNKEGACPGTHGFVLNKQEMLEDIKDSLEKIACHMKTYMDL